MWQMWKFLSLRNLGAWGVGWGLAASWPLQRSFLRATKPALHSTGMPLLDYTLRSQGWGPTQDPLCWHPLRPCPEPLLLSLHPNALFPFLPVALIINNASFSRFYQHLGPTGLW